MASSLVIQAARFGDLVQSRQLMLRLACKGAVHLLVDKTLAPLAKLIYPFATIHGLQFHCQPGELADGKDMLENNRKIFADLRQSDFARIYNLNFSPATAAVCRLFEADKVVGHRPVHGRGVQRSPLVRLAFRLGSRRRITPLNLVDYWGYFADDEPNEPGRSGQESLKDVSGGYRSNCCDRSSLPAHGITNDQEHSETLSTRSEDIYPPAKPGGRGLGVVMAGRVSRRSLPLPLLASIIQTAAAILGSGQIYLFGTRDEQQLSSRLLRQLRPDIGKRVIDLCGKTDWAALIENLTSLDALITPDTGTMHLAAMLGVPVLGFFLSNAWCHETGPYGSGHRIFQAMPDCAPCLESAPCPCDTVCLKNLQSPQLLRGVARALAGDRNFPMPPGVACLESSIDSFGLRYTPIAGQETGKEQESREAVRLLIRRFVGNGIGTCGQYFAEIAGDSPESEKLPADLMAGLSDWLFPESEWMLPSWRYC